MILSNIRRFGKSLKWELLVFIIPIAIIPGMLVGIISYSVSSNIILNNAMKSTYDLQLQTNQSIYYALAGINDIIDSPLYSDGFIQTCRIANRLDNTDTSQNDTINRFLAQFFYSNKSIHSILLLTMNDLFYSIASDGNIKSTKYSEVKNTKWCMDLINNAGVTSWKEAGSREYFNKNGENYLVIGRLLRDTLNLKPLGIYIINVDPSILSNQYSKIKLKYNGEFFIINEEGIIISHSQKENIGTELDFVNYPKDILKAEHFTKIDSTGSYKKLIISTAIGTTSWKLISVFPYTSLMEEAERIKWVSIFVVLISTAIVFLFSVKFSSSIIYPINQLIKSMNKIKHGDFDVRLNISSYNEINVLSDNFNNMAGNIQKLLKSIHEANLAKSQLDLKVVQSELKALQAQINPHFIYNTLESLNVLAKLNKQTEISNMILSLARFFRLSLSKGNEIIQIRQELDMVMEYANLQRISHSQNFTCALIPENNIKDYNIVKFTLQPLVENCIYHSFADIEYSGKIVISGFENTDSITLYVSDNGTGLSEEAIELLNRQMQNISVEEGPSNNGFGVKNVNSRLKLHFGNEYGLSFKSNEDGGVTVVVNIPKIRSMGGNTCD